MRLRHINIEALEKADNAFNQLVIIRPHGSKLFRILQVPESMVENEELIQVLHTLCVHYHEPSAIWFFRFDTQDDMVDFGMTLAHMGIEHIIIEPETIGPELKTLYPN